MAWRLAKSLEKLRSQANAAAPNRDKSADGTIGDAAHSSRTSDHNPNPAGVVCALDITHDPNDGLDSYKLAETLKASADERLKYIISNGRIWNPSVAAGWRKYTGKNPHSHHVHVSVKSGPLADDTRDWQIGLAKAGILERAVVAIADVIAPPPPKYPTLKRGDKGEEVGRIQRLLDFASKDIDGDFGRKTEMAVKAFQRAKQLVPDGKVGTYTWKALGA
jgi:hypothetical protein